MRSTVEDRGRPIPPGAPAPDFSLRSGPDEIVSLERFRGRPLIIAFYPADWSPVCGDQMSLYQAVLPEFEEYGARIVGISVDGPWSHAAYAKQRGITFPLLSDFEPKGEVARAFGVYRAEEGVSERALFVLDGEGVVRWSHVSPGEVNPGADGILQALQSLSGESA
jgi:peroxiredoxin (alkyl hydroperoxide reductase subunit C)